MVQEQIQTSGVPAGGVPDSPFDSLFAAGGDPFPIFKMLRAASPVMKLPGDGNFYAVFKYDDVLRILRDPETFSSMVDARSMRGEERPPTILFDDPPIHTRMRGLISKAFTPRTIELQRPAIEAACRRMVDSMCAQGTFDYVQELSYPLPVMVIAGMLGVQDGDMATFKRWSDAIIQNVGVTLITGDDTAVADVNLEFDAYFSARLDKLRREPEDNLLSALVHAIDEEGNRLSTEDLLVVCRVLLVAGNETTTGLLVNLARVFSEHPEVVTQVRENLDLVPSLLEETLRYYPPFFATIRRTTRDVELSGTTLPAQARLLALLASANRDETVFERADEFIVDRQPNRHLGFGMGIHYCVGAPLARLEADIAVRTLLPRITALKIGETTEDQLLRIGGPESMKVTLTLAQSVPARA